MAHVTGEGKTGEGRERVGETCLHPSRLGSNQDAASGNLQRSFLKSTRRLLEHLELSPFLWNSPSHVAAVERRAWWGEEETSEAERHLGSPESWSWSWGFTHDQNRCHSQVAMEKSDPDVMTQGKTV